MFEIDVRFFSSSSFLSGTGKFGFGLGATKKEIFLILFNHKSGVRGLECACAKIKKYEK